MKKIYLGLSFILGFLVISCGSNANTKKQKPLITEQLPRQEISEDENLITKDQGQEQTPLPIRLEGTTEEKIAGFLKEFRECKEAGTKEGYCSEETVTWDPRSTFKGNSNNRTVMVIDSGFVYSYFEGRYESRTKAILKISPDFSYVDMTPKTFSVSKGYLYFFRELTASADNFMLLKDFENYFAEMKLFTEDLKKISDVSDKDGTRAHGTLVANYIYELAPKANVVIAKMPDKETAKFLCEKDFEKFKKINVQLAESLIKKVDELQVNIINLSQGVNQDAVRSVFTNICHIDPTDADINNALDAFLPFYEKLANIPHVALIQAAGVFNSTEETTAKFSPVDCAVNSIMPNRFRIDVAALGSNTIISPEGSQWNLLSKSTNSDFKGHSCVDAYVNIQFDGEYAFKGPDGWRWMPLGYFFSSFVAPIFTALLLNWDDQGVIDLDDMGNISGKVKPNDQPMVWEPLKYDLLNYF